MSEEKVIQFSDVIASKVNSGGGGSGMNLVTKEQFEEYKEHTKTRFNTLDEKIEKIDKTVDSTKSKVSNIFWVSLGILATVIVGFAGVIATLI